MTGKEQDALWVALREWRLKLLRRGVVHHGQPFDTLYTKHHIIVRA